MYYLAYGSNMNKGMMSTRCRDAVAIGQAKLKGYRLHFSHHATIVPDENSEVLCGLWEISVDDEKALDMYEGYPEYYRKETVEAEYNGKTINAMAYIMNGDCPYSEPHHYYLATIIQGYRDFGYQFDISKAKA